MANCDEGECAQALERVVEARNRILSICSDLDQFRTDQAAHRTQAIVALVAAMGMMAIAAGLLLLPWPFSLAAAVPLAIVAVLLVVFIVQMALVASLQQRVIDATQRLVEARAEFDAAVATVLDECDQECWALVDLDQPTCVGSEDETSRTDAPLESPVRR